MSQADIWYIRFPDGRVLRAASTTILRQELSARRIPLGSTVRRAPSDEWVSLEWTQEFADLIEELASKPPPRRSPNAAALPHNHTAPVAPSARHAGTPDNDHPATVGSRLDPSRLHLVGVHGYFDELLAALDSTLVGKKLLLGLIAGLLLGAMFVLSRAASFEQADGSLPIVWLLLALGLFVVDGVGVLLARLTYLELARLRPPSWREGLRGLGRLIVWVAISQLLIWGILGSLIVLFRWLPFWLGPGDAESWTTSQQIVAGIDLAVGMILEVLVYLVFALWWLLPSLLAAENCTVWSGLGQWLSLLRRNLGSVLLYQVMAVAVGGLLTVPFWLLIGPLMLPSFYPPEELHEVASAMRLVLVGLACAPLLTYWIIANVFIYLNLRYGASSQR